MLLDDSREEGRRPTSDPVEDLCQLIRDYQADRPGLEDEIADWFERLGVVSVSQAKRNEMSKGQAYKIAMVGLFVIIPEF